MCRFACRGYQLRRGGGVKALGVSANYPDFAVPLTVKVVGDNFDD
jgi:hypothetical protein